MRGAGTFQIIGLFLFFFFAAMAVVAKIADTPLMASVLCASDSAVLNSVAGCASTPVVAVDDAPGDTVLPHTELALAATNVAPVTTSQAAPAAAYVPPADSSSRILFLLQKLDQVLNTIIFNQQAVRDDLNRLDDRIDSISDRVASQSDRDRDDLRDQISDITDDATLTGSLTLSDLTGGLLVTDVDGSVSTTSVVSSIEDLSDVASMTESAGDLLYWNGAAWSSIATSSLGLASSVTGTSTEIAYFGGDGSLTSSPGFTFDDAQLTVPSLSVGDTLHVSVSPIGNDSYSSNPYRFAGSLFSSFGTLIDLQGDTNELHTFGADMATGIMAITSRGAIVESTDAGDNYSLIGSLFIKPPLITDNDATVENTATVYIDGAPSTTVTGGNYALWVASSTSVSRFDGLVTVTGTTTFAGGNFIINADGSVEAQSRGSFSSLFIGSNAGAGITAIDGLSFSNFFGYYAGVNATGASESNFFGNSAGYEATNAYSSNFFGTSAGQSATDAEYANFLGYEAGRDATSAANSNFFGYQAGYQATDASNSNFFGNGSGYFAVTAAQSNFFGTSAGYNATNASVSNFFGLSAGDSAEDASYSNFFGYQAGSSALESSNSNFLGNHAGAFATNAANSIFIGSYSGYLDTVNNASSTASTSIAIGQYAGTGGYSDSIAIGHGVKNSAAAQLNLGNVLYATGIYASDTATSTPTAGNVGIGTSTPSAQFTTTGTVRFANFGSGTLTTDASGNLSVSSDERLKDIEGAFTAGLDALRGLEPIQYHWNKTSGLDRTTLYTGFSAQNVQEFIPEAVGVDPRGYLTLSDRPILATAVNAIQELDLTIEDLATTTLYRDLSNESFTKRFFDTLIAWFSDTANGIGTMVAEVFNATEMICVDNECLNAADIRELKSLTGSETRSPEPEHVENTENTETTVDDGTDAAAIDDTNAATTDNGTQPPAEDTNTPDEPADEPPAEEEIDPETPGDSEETQDPVIEDEPASDEPAGEEPPEVPADTPSEPAST